MHPLFQIVCSRKTWAQTAHLFDASLLNVANWRCCQKELVLNIWFSCVTDKWTGTYIPPLSANWALRALSAASLIHSITHNHTVLLSVPKCSLTVAHTLTFQSKHWGEIRVLCLAQGYFNRRSPGLIHWPPNRLIICSATWATATHTEQKVSQKWLWLDFCLLAQFSIVHCY